MMDRRMLLRRGGLGALALGLGACASGDDGAAQAPEQEGGGSEAGAGLLNQFPTLDNQYWQDWNAGGEQAAAALGIAYQQATYEDSIEEQLSQIESAPSQNVDKVFMFAQNAASSVQLITTAAELGIYVVNAHSNAAWSTPLEPAFQGRYLTFLAPDNVAGSRAMAGSIFEQLGGSGKVINLSGIPGNTSNTERSLGVDQALEDYPGMELVARENGGENRVDAQAVIENLLTAHPDVNAIVCHNDDSAIAVLNALRDRGLDDVLVGGVDAIAEFLDAITAGPNAAATTAIHGGWLGGFAVVRAFDGAAGVELDPVERMLYQDSLVIDTPDAAGAYVELIYGADSLPFDWEGMSRQLHPDDWNPQIGIAPIDPEDYWGRIGEEQPSGYALPDELQQSIDGGGLDTLAERYRSAVTASPLAEVIGLTQSKQTVLGFS